MTHQVFLCHAVEDREAASRVGEVLEAHGLGCWFAPRDLTPDSDPAAQTLEAIRTSGLVLLVFSTFANESPYVLREIERAIAYDRPVLSLHLDDTVPNPSIEYYLNLWQWLDVRGGVETSGDAIVAAVKGQLTRVGPGTQPREAHEDAAPGTEAAPQQAAAGTSSAGKRKRRRWFAAAIVGVVALLAVLAVAAFIALRPAHNAWTDLAPAGNLPQPRWQHEMVYDADTARVIMFGGTLTWAVLNDTWSYDPAANIWKKLRPAGDLPAPRCGQAMAYDPSTNRVLVFGGAGVMQGDAVFPPTLGDLWSYNPSANTWTQLEPSGPAPTPRAQLTMVYDPATKHVLLFGGIEYAETGETRMNDLWAYDPQANRWSRLDPRGALPEARAWHRMVRDPATGRFILFGGAYAQMAGVLDDTWAYDPTANAWTRIDPVRKPPGRSGHTIVYDPVSSRVLMFGGAEGEGVPPLNDLWAFDPRDNTWTELQPNGGWPAAMCASSVADPQSGRVITFGGNITRKDAFGTLLNQTWAYTP